MISSNYDVNLTLRRYAGGSFYSWCCLIRPYLIENMQIMKMVSKIIANNSTVVSSAIFNITSALLLCY